MKWIAKLVTAAQAVLLAQLGAAKPGDAATPSHFTEAAEWDAAISAGTPEALQQFISHYPHGVRLGDAFELIVQSEIEAAMSRPEAAATGIQLSEARREGVELLEQDFDVGPAPKDDDSNEDGGPLGPY